MPAVFACGPGAKDLTPEDLRVIQGFPHWMKAFKAGELATIPDCRCSGERCDGHVTLDDGKPWPAPELPEAHRD